MPAFVGHLDGVAEPSVISSAALSSGLRTSLGSAGNVDVDRQIFLVLWLVSAFSSSFFSSPHIYHPKQTI